MRYEYSSLNAPATTTTGLAVNVSPWIDKVVSLDSYTNGTYQVQVSIDGVTFVNYGAAFTAVGVLTIPFACLAVRINTTVAGTATARVAGQLPNG